MLYINSTKVIVTMHLYQKCRFILNLLLLMETVRHSEVSMALFNSIRLQMRRYKPHFNPTFPPL